MSKKILKCISSIIILIIILSLCGCGKENYDNFYVNGIEYRYNTLTDSYEVVDITIWAGKNISIPNIVRGKPVTSIRVSYELIHLPYGIKTLILPNTLKEINMNVYEECEKLEYNEYDNGLYLGTNDNPYFALIRVKSEEKNGVVEKYSYNQIQSFEVKKETPPTPPYHLDVSCVTSCKIHPDTVIIAESAMSNCINLKSIIIPDSVEYINSHAFAACDLLEDVTFGDGIQNVGMNIFDWCLNMKKIYIPKQLDCFSLEELFSYDIKEIEYGGTIEEWMVLYSDTNNYNLPFKIVCTDGIIENK